MLYDDLVDSNAATDDETGAIENQVDAESFRVKSPLDLTQNVDRFLCNVCGKEFNKIGFLNTHLKVLHGTERDHDCVYCGKKFVIKFRLLKHINIVHRDKFQFECRRCALLFDTETDLLVHRNVTECCSRDKAFDCASCPKLFWRHYDRQLHRKRFHPDAIVHPCEICNIDFPSVETLREHAFLHEKRFEKSDQTLQCELCEKFCSSIENLQKHVLGHNGEKPFVCRCCFERFPDETDLTNHITKNHTNGKKNVCYYCGKSYVFESVLRTHIVKYHSDKKKCYCDVCQKRSELKINSKKIQTDQIFVCKYCGRRFLRKYNLDRHVNRHFGINVIPNEMCPTQKRKRKLKAIK